MIDLIVSILFLWYVSRFWFKPIKKFKGRKRFDSFFDLLIGDCGSGKSTYGAKLLIDYKKKGYPVYSNIYVQGTRKFDIDDFMTFDFEPGAVVLFDEAATYGLASRGDSYKKSNTAKIIEFFTMYRHYDFQHIIIISPSFQDVIPIVRSRVKNITVVEGTFFLFLLTLPVNIILYLFKKTPIKFGSLRYVFKRIDVIGDNKKGSASEPKEVYNWIPLKRKYFLMNPYFKYFNSYSKKDLPGKAWEVWGGISTIDKKRTFKDFFIRFINFIKLPCLFVCFKKVIKTFSKKVFTK
ncbi:MAG: hypothetical protein ACLRRH_11450 [Clostridium sp.]